MSSVKLLTFAVATIVTCPQVLMAQGTAPEPPSGSGRATGIEEVVVTARRKEEGMQDVPISVSALDSNLLENLQIQNFGDVGQTIPNLNVQRQFGSASSPQFYVRGVSTGSLKFETDAGIGLYIDGVYLGRPAGTAFDLADVERVEVLRGPQGTLFGRNSTGGAINFVTRAPSGEFGIDGELSAGNFGLLRAKLAVDLPEVAGFSARLTYLHNEMDGYVDRSGPATTYDFSSPFGHLKAADDFGNEDTDAFGVAIHYGGVEGLSVDYKFDFTQKDSSQLGPQLLAFTDPGTEGLFTASGGIAASTDRLDSLPIDTSQTDLEVQGHALTVAYDFTDHLSVKSITSYREFHEDGNFNDIDGNRLTGDLFGFAGQPFTYISAIQERKQHQFSEELQLLGRTDRLDWIAGLFYFNERGHDDNPVFIGTVFPTDITYEPGVTGLSLFLTGAGIPASFADYFAGAKSAVENESRAAYAHATYQLSDAFDLSAGIRYTEDDRHSDIDQSAFILDQSFEESGDHTDWDAALTWKINEDVNAYIKAATGYLSGGVLGGVKFEPEEILSYELGLKTDLFDNRLRFNAAVFRSERENLQALSFSAASGTFLINGGDIDQEGFEIEATAVPIDGLTLTANYGHLDAGAGGTTRSLAPENNWYLAAQYDFAPFNNGSYLSARLDASWVDDHYGLPCPVGVPATPEGCGDTSTALMDIDRAVTQKATTLVGARIALVDLPLGNGRWQVAAWGRNLLDEDELEFVREINGNIIGTFMAPRTYGVDVKLDF